MISFETKSSSPPRISEKYAKNLKKMGIETVRDLLFHFPFRYEDYSKFSSIANIGKEETATIIGKIIQAKTSRTWKRKMFITEVLVQDESGTIKAVWFNQPYLADSLKIGKDIRLSGKVCPAKSSGSAAKLFAKVDSHPSSLFFSNPVWELASREPTNTGRLVPVYPETEGVTSRWMRWQIQILLKNRIVFPDPIPQEILKKLNLPTLEKSLKYIHFPESDNQYLVARKRFAFQEMFLFQLKSIRMKSAWDKKKAPQIPFDERLIRSFSSALPFKLTDAQRKATYEILRDLEKNRPMNRLLNGDVGSGKTIVAALAALQTIDQGYQVAIMAPTEVLAKQHYEGLCKIFIDYKIKIGLITSSYKLFNKDSEIKNQKDKKIILNSQFIIHNSNLIIGTHALIQNDIKFKNLALVIVDEQHRFGVEQRAYLQKKAGEINDGLANLIPHFLTMTATPIPRTLALAFFGNLDLSILDEMPKNRKKIITRFVGPLERQSIYDFIRKEITSGRQCFVILPLVEESQSLADVKAAVQETKRLAKDIFPDLKIGLLHGRLKPAEKEDVMAGFKDKDIDILVATAVVEVGIDIPNATIMVIEDADRFGLSQLHQFRGRIGRGEHQSYCFLFSSVNSVQAKKRLKALVESQDGFKIAEMDLKLRGPGEFFGKRQSGMPDIAMENLTNAKLIQIARQAARDLVRDDPSLEDFPELKKELAKMIEVIHFE